MIPDRKTAWEHPVAQNRKLVDGTFLSLDNCGYSTKNTANIDFVSVVEYSVKTGCSSGDTTPIPNNSDSGGNTAGHYDEEEK